VPAGLQPVTSSGSGPFGHFRAHTRCHSTNMRDSVMRDQVVGRDAELQATSAFLRAMAGGPAGLVFAGEPGIGKTTLWRHVIGQARRGRSIGVVSARPVAADARYGYAVLEDLGR
jgi:hypothetical protein